MKSSRKSTTLKQYNGEHMRHNKIGPNESDFVKDKRNTHCAGCMNENGYCTAQDVLICWLKKTYLPEGEFQKAVESDLMTENMNNITDEINSHILQELKNDRKFTFFF